MLWQSLCSVQSRAAMRMSSRQQCCPHLRGPVRRCLGRLTRPSRGGPPSVSWRQDGGEDGVVLYEFFSHVSCVYLPSMLSSQGKNPHTLHISPHTPLSHLPSPPPSYPPLSSPFPTSLIFSPSLIPLPPPFLSHFLTLSHPHPHPPLLSSQTYNNISSYRIPLSSS